MAARVLLWGLIAAGAARGLFPTPERPDPGPAGHPPDHQAEGVAAAFLREYLTVGDDRAARARRLRQFTVAGTELRGSVSVPTGVAQYLDQVVAAGSSPVAGGIEVTVLAHVLQVRSSGYRDGGTLAFVVPLAVLPQGVAVRGRPRPTAPPIASGMPDAGQPAAPTMSASRQQAAPTALSRPASRVARQAVAAFVAADDSTLARLGGGRPPSARPLPAGWHAIRSVRGFHSLICVFFTGSPLSRSYAERCFSDRY
jgi:hypothetical protein